MPPGYRVKHRYNFGEGAFYVRAHGHVLNGKVQLDEILIYEDEDYPSGGLSAAQIASVPLRSIQAAMVEQHWDRHPLPDWTEVIPTRGTSAFWDWAARLYKHCVDEGRPPVLTLSSVVGVHRDTAKGWAKRLREQGRLEAYQPAQEEP